MELVRLTESWRPYPDNSTALRKELMPPRVRRGVRVHRGMSSEGESAWI